MNILILGPKCPGNAAECHDRGFCYNGVCFCTDGYAGVSCGELLLPPE